MTEQVEYTANRDCNSSVHSSRLIEPDKEPITRRDRKVYPTRLCKLTRFAKMGRVNSGVIDFSHALTVIHFPADRVDLISAVGNGENAQKAASTHLSESFAVLAAAGLATGLVKAVLAESVELVTVEEDFNVSPGCMQTHTQQM